MIIQDRKDILWEIFLDCPEFKEIEVTIDDMNDVLDDCRIWTTAPGNPIDQKEGVEINSGSGLIIKGPISSEELKEERIECLCNVIRYLATVIVQIKDEK